jgi:hypothetical protein
MCSVFFALFFLDFSHSNCDWFFKFSRTPIHNSTANQRLCEFHHQDCAIFDEVFECFDWWNVSVFSTDQGATLIGI